MNNINLGSIQLPPQAGTKSFAILAKRGAGKSYTAAVMAEEFYKVNIPFVVFDPIDVWWGLRFNKDGKSKGLPVVVFGLSHADIPLSKDMGRDIARAVVKENISCVISTFGMPKVAQRHLIAEFADELLIINNSPRHVFVEEAHEFVPQRVTGDLGKTFAAVESLVVMGRNRGLGVTLINQRAATLNKDVLTQIDTLLAFRNVAPQDRNALHDWVEHHAAEGDFSAFMQSLPSLPTGEGWIWSPEWLEKFERIKIRERETFHPDREKLGENFTMPEMKPADIQDFISKFPLVPAEMPGPITKQKDPVHKVVSEAEVRTAIENATKDIKLAYETKIRSYQRCIEGIMAVCKKFNEELDAVSIPQNDGAIGKIPLISTRPPHEKINSTGKALPEAAKKIYRFLYANDEGGFTKVQIGAITGYAHNSGHFSNMLYKLQSLDLIEKKGDLIFLKKRDESLSGNGGEILTINLWKRKLPKAPGKIFEFLLDNPEESYTKQELAMAVGYACDSGHFNNSLYKLRQLGLVQKNENNFFINAELLHLQ